MKKLVLAIGLVGLLVSCGGEDKVLKKGKEIQKATCACKDVACLDKVDADAQAWFEKNIKGPPSESTMKKMEPIEKAAKACEETVRKAAGEAKMAESMTKMKGFKDQMCACTDADCANKVQTAMNDWSTAMSKDATDVKPSEEQMKEMTAVSQALGECMTKAMTPPTPPADPAAPPAPPPAATP